MHISDNHLKLGIIISTLILLLFIYCTEFNGHTLKSNKASADFMTNEQAFLSTTNTPSSSIELPCDCPTSNVTFVKHGEYQPLVVPEDMDAMQPDVLDKVNLNKLRDNTVIVTVASYGMRDELYNWMKHMESAKETKYVVFCTDRKIYLHLIVAGYEERAVLIPEDWLVGGPEMFADTELSLLDVPRLSHVKTWILQRLVYAHVNVLMLDVNQIMLHKRTVEYMQTLLQLRHDTQMIATQDSADQHVVNTGLLLLRNDAKQVKRVLTRTIQIQEQQPHLTQQEAFNKALDQQEMHVKTGMTVLLDIVHFPNGVYYFEKHLPQSQGIQPYIIHANHKSGQDRVKLLQESKLWKLNEDFVNSVSHQVDEIYRRAQTLKGQESSTDNLQNA